MTPEKIAELEHDAQRWRNAHDKILEVVADREKEMCEDLREAVHRIAELENEVARLRQQSRLASDSLADAHEDTKRLDFLEKSMKNNVWPVFALEVHDGTICGLNMLACFEPEFICGETLRDAIDAARRAK